MLTIVTPAADRSLLTLAQARAAVGIGSSDTSQDAALTAAILQVSDRIARECRIAGDGQAPPTLRLEPASEVMRLSRCLPQIILSRRFVKAITTVVEDGTTLMAADYEIDKGAGLLRRIDGDEPWEWQPGKVTITYEAGFDTVPPDLVLAASAALRETWSASERDPLLKSETVDGVGKFDYWVGGIGGASSGSSFSTTVASMLDPYRQMWV